MPARRVKEPQARFVFKGTVQKLKASTIPAAKGAKLTAIVRVDEVVRAPEALSQYAGHDITVDLAGPQTLKAGQRATFYSTGWIFGDSIAVQAIFHPLLEADHVTMSAIAGDPVANLANHDAKSRFDGARVVVSGQVVSVNLPAGPAPAALLAGGVGPTQRLSEHDPVWLDAVIQVHAVHKGSHSGKKAVVRFPASHDVLWHQAPKFQAGQEGFFMLHRGEPNEPKRQRFAFAAGGDDRAYTALHPADFQPYDHPGGVRAMIDAATNAGTRRTRNPNE
jgi:hypothetical protein